MRPLTVSLTLPRRNVILDVPGSTKSVSVFVCELFARGVAVRSGVGWVFAGRFCGVTSGFAVLLFERGVDIGSGVGDTAAPPLVPASFDHTKYAPTAPATVINSNAARAIAMYFQ
jgi:hypothetical protein